MDIEQISKVNANRWMIMYLTDLSFLLQFESKKQEFDNDKYMDLVQKKAFDSITEDECDELESLEDLKYRIDHFQTWSKILERAPKLFKAPGLEPNELFSNYLILSKQFLGQDMMEFEARVSRAGIDRREVCDIVIQEKLAYGFDYLEYMISGTEAYHFDFIKLTLEVARIEFIKWLLKEKGEEVIGENGTIEVHDKIKWIGKPSQLGYIIRELVDKGFIDPPRRGAKPSFAALARLVDTCFEHNSTVENITKEIKETSLSPDFIKKIRIPKCPDK